MRARRARGTDRQTPILVPRVGLSASTAAIPRHPPLSPLMTTLCDIHLCFGVAPLATLATPWSGTTPPR